MAYAAAPDDSFRCTESAALSICVDRIETLVVFPELEGDQIVLKSFQETLAEFERIFARKLSYVPKVLFLSSKRLTALTAAPSWASALFQDRVIYITINSDHSLNRRQISRSFRHELIHMHVAELSRSKAPAWFDEGLAMYLSGDGARLKPKDEELGESSALEFDPEHRTFLRLKKASAEEVYLKVEALVRSLIFRKGFGAVRAYLTAVGQGADRNDEFEKVFGQPAPKLP